MSKNQIQNFSPFARVPACTKVEMHYNIWQGEGETEGQRAAEVTIAVLNDCLKLIHLEESELAVPLLEAVKVF